MEELQNLKDTVDQDTFMESNDVKYTEQQTPPDSEKLEHKTMIDSVDVVSDVQELPDSHAEPRADSSGLDVNAPPESEVLLVTASALPSNTKLNSLELDEADNVGPHEHKRLDQRSLSTCCEIAEDDDDATFIEQLPQTDSENLEVKTMPDSVDAVHDVQDFPHSYTEARADFSGLDVNVPPGSEALVATASDLPNYNKLNLSELDEAHNLGPHEHKRLYQRSLSTSSDIAVDDGVFCEPSPDHCTGEMETDNEDIAPVVFYPDHMVYRDSYSADCVLTFTSNCIEIEGSTLDGDDKTFKLQWGVQDIHHMKSHWYEMVNVAIVTFHVLMEDMEQDKNVEYPSGIELKFAVIGTNWYGSQEAITSLNAAYKTLWSNMLESEDTVHGRTQASLTKYFPNFDQPFEEVIYPKGDVDAVSMGKRDVDMLLPDIFVNDTIIDFYIKYLKNKMKPEERQRFHFFNSFFFRKLVDPDKNPLDASQGKAAFQRVRKWTRKVNIFEKDYVFIPINYNYHWSLIVMCHLGEVATYKDEDVTELIKVPCVLHMDSIRGTHTGLKGLMQSYLKEEWKGRLQEAPEDISSRFDNLRFISLELPQQPNSFDCGLFLLHYVELFLEEAPVNFNLFKITKSVNFLNVDWFPPADASLKRVVIQRLVNDLLEQPSHEASSIVANDECDIPKGTAVNFFPEMCNNPSTACQTSQDNQGIKISLLPSLSLSNEPCPVDPSESLKPAFEPGSFLNMQFPSFNETMFHGYKRSHAPPIEEDVGTGGQFVYSSTEIDLQQDNGITAEIPFLSNDFKSSESWHQNKKFETSPQTSISGCEDSFQVINGSNQIGEELDFKEMRNGPISPFTEPVEMLYDNDNADNLTFSPHNSKRQANEPTGSGESSGLELDVQHPTKRMRMSEPPLEGASASD